MLAGGTPLLAQDDQVRLALDNLVAAYPSALAGHDGKALRWRDGTVMPVSDGTESKTFPELLRHASIIDQLRIPYPRGPLEKPPAVDADPGRFRNTAFFTKMYGDCQMGRAPPRLASLAWLPKIWGKSIRITSLNGVDEHLRAVSAEIDALPEKIKRAAYPIAGTYNCRAVADTGQPSPHSYGIAIDLNTAFSNYWYWRRRMTAPSFIATACPKRSSRSSRDTASFGVASGITSTRCTSNIDPNSLLRREIGIPSPGDGIWFVECPPDRPAIPPCRVRRAGRAGRADW